MFHVLQSSSHSPFYNLQTECSLLHKEDNILFLYRNTPSVIVGRHQSIQAEVNLEFCQQYGIDVFRRSSGGGAVYHDLGNINWAFISNRTKTPLLDTNPCIPMVQFLKSLHVNVEIGKRQELLVDGLKISGTASKVTKTRQLFHGTLLYNSNLTFLTRSLQGNTRYRGRSIASVPGSVINLSMLLEDKRSIEEFINCMVSYFQTYH